MLPTTIPASFAQLLAGLRGCFTAPSFATFTWLATGLLCWPELSTVTGMWQGAGLAGRVHHDRAHRFFATARWSTDQLGLAVARLVVAALVPDGQPVTVAVDDTLVKRSSRRLRGAWWHHDATASRSGTLAWGHCWVVVGILVRLPHTTRVVCLPVLARLWQPGDERPTRLELAHQLIRLLAAAVGGRTIDAVGDAAYASNSPVGLPGNVTLTSRLRKDAALHQLPGPRQPGQRGRPRTKGPRLPSLATLADLHTHDFTTVTVCRYGTTEQVGVYRLRCLWYRAWGTRPVQVVLVRDPGTTNGFDLALVSTDLAATPAELVCRYAARWSVEQAFFDGKHLIGVGQARNRTPKAIQRTVPFTLACQTLLSVWYATTQTASGDLALHRRLRPWYRHKRTIATSDQLACFRRACWPEFRHGQPQPATSPKPIHDPATSDVTAA